MSEITPTSDSGRLYQVKFWRGYGLAIGYLVWGTIGIAAWFGFHAGDPETNSVLTALGILAPAFIGFGLYKFVEALSGYPCLIATRDGIAYKTVIRRKWADWNNLSAFKAEWVWRYGWTAVSSISGADESESVLRRKKIILRDIFASPLRTIIT